MDKLTVNLQFGKYNHVVVEADIRGFFDNIDHEIMLEMLAVRVDDKALLWLVKKWLKAGILEEDGKVFHPTTGTPQGGIISPILANVYLHYALDQCVGRICLLVNSSEDWLLILTPNRFGTLKLSDPLLRHNNVMLADGVECLHLANVRGGIKLRRLYDTLKVLCARYLVSG